MVYEYLDRVGAYGKGKAVSMEQVKEALHMMDTRSVREAVRIERGKGGMLIGSMPGIGGGYYIPSNDAEILEMKRRLEKRFVSAADSVRPFRKAAKEIEQRRAKQDGEKE